MMTMTLPELKVKIGEARWTAIKEARAAARCNRSRGTFLATADNRGDQCAPFPEAEAHDWDGTLRQINECISAAKTFPAVQEVYICGGYDGADSVRAFTMDEDYEPWVSAWKVTVWTR
jgi:hypothetical protein